MESVKWAKIKDLFDFVYSKTYIYTFALLFYFALLNYLIKSVSICCVDGEWLYSCYIEAGGMNDVPCASQN